MSGKSDKCNQKSIGIFGFGCVGQGLYDILQHDNQLGVRVANICVKNKNKTRTLPASAFVHNPQELLQDTSLDLLAEVISDPVEAYQLLQQALKEGKTVVSANKKVVAEHLPELLQLQQEYGGVLLYEAAVCGSIPILRTLEAYYGTEPLQEVSGILNGSSNYILTKLDKEGLSYQEALRQAQELGFAEADPTLDVQGHDALHKVCIIAAHAFGAVVKPNEQLRFGIAAISEQDVALAQALGARIKLVASASVGAAGALGVQVIPTFVFPENELFAVDYEYNGVQLTAKFAGTQFLKGRGAGSHPTGSAVWADVAAALRGYRYGYQKLKKSHSYTSSNSDLIQAYLRINTNNFLELPWQTVNKLRSGADGELYVGTIKRADLIQYQKALEVAGAFVAQLPEHISADDIAKFTGVPEEALV